MESRQELDFILFLSIDFLACRLRLLSDSEFIEKDTLFILELDD